MNKIWKKRLNVGTIFTLAICMLMEIITISPIKVEAEISTHNVEEIADFDLDVYRADIYLKNGTPANNAIKSMQSFSYPSQTIVDALDSKDSSFQKRVEQWKAVHYATTPSGIINGKLDEKGYYEAIILSVFISQSENSNFFVDQVDKINSEVNTIFKNVSDRIKQNDNMEISRIKMDQNLFALTGKEKEELIKYCEELFKENHPLLDNITYVTDTIKTVFSISDTISEAFERMCTYTQLCELSQQRKAVLQEMHDICPSSNTTLKMALSEIVDSMDSFDSAILATFGNAEISQGNKFIGTLFDKGWEAVIQSNPYSAAFMSGASFGTFLGDTICNSLFSTDKTIEQYIKMKCLGEFNELMQFVSQDFANTYQNNKTSQNAKNYIASVDTIFSIASLSCDFAKSYGSIIYDDALIGKLVNHAKDIDHFYATIERTKEDYNGIHKILTNSYQARLEADYPDLYKIIMGVEDEKEEKQDGIAVTGISFLNDKMTLILDESALYFVEKPVIIPANAANQDIIYSSSDTSVLMVDKSSGRIITKKVGTAIITATSIESGIKDTIMVSVEENNIKKNFLSCKRTSSAVIKEDGSLWTWGLNNYGQLGDGTTEDRLTPVKIMDDVISISIIENRSAAIKKDGSLWTWGQNDCGQLGDGTTEDRLTPVKIMDDVVSLSLTEANGAAIKKDGSLWTWGYNFVGGVGDGTREDRLTPVKIMDDVKSVSLVDASGAVIKKDGSLWTWGIYSNKIETPVKIMDDVISISLHDELSHTTVAIIRKDGSLWTWGNNVYGQLGDGTTEVRTTPVKIMNDVASVAIVKGNGAAIKSDGSLWIWGDNFWGQIGDGTTEVRLTPVKIMDNVKNIYLTNNNIATIKEDRSLWVWGCNVEGQVGDGTTTNRLIPVKIMDDVISVYLMYANGVAIKKDGSLWTWGDNYYGQLGDGTREDKLTPVKIMDNIATDQTNIVNNNINIKDCTVSLPKTKYTYTGKKITPRPVVKYQGKLLKNKKDYTLSYKNNKKVGKATIIIKGKGNYTGKKTITFRIMSKPKEKTKNIAE